MSARFCTEPSMDELKKWLEIQTELFLGAKHCEIHQKLDLILH